MKKSIFTLALTTFIATTVLVSCQDTSKKEEQAQDNVEDARRDLDDAKEELSDARQAATAEEWKSFRESTDSTIRQNELRIAQMKANMKNTGKSIDEMYAKKIEELEQKNNNIKLQVQAYKNDTNSDWEEFKEEYNRDMNELGAAMKNLTVDNK